jgi:MFS family permease
VVSLSNSSASSAKLFTKCFVLVWFSALGLNLCQNILNNAISLYVTSIGFSTGFAGSLGIPYAICAIVMRFLGGNWVDRHSRRSLLAFGCFAFGISALLFGLIPSAVALLLFRAIHGFSFSAGQLASSTINVDVTPKEKSTLGIGIFWVSSAISIGCAGYAVTALTSGGSYQPMFWACAISAIVGGVLALLCDYEKKQPVASVEKAPPAASARERILRFVEPSAAKPAILMFMMAGSISCVSMYMLLFAQTVGYSNAGLALVFATIGMAIGNLSSDGLMRGIGARNTLLFSFALCAVGFVAMAEIHSMATYLLGGTVYGFLQGICMPVLYSLAVDKMPANRRGVAGGTVYCMLDLGVGAGSYIWGVVIGIGGFAVTFDAAAAVLVAAIVLTFVFYPRSKEA